MARRRKFVYPPPKTGGPPPVAPGAFDPRNPPGRTVSINLQAVTGRREIKMGDKVRILSGLYAGEIATVESVAGGVIPAASVKTEAGRTRRARTIDLEPVRPGSISPEPRGEAAASAEPTPEP
ncbi:MAG: hypothetical protein HYX57_05205 [Chloroflexi bacterium]|nr:hypothetical protein [Chloroflexota bacterium]